jgi:hypothetical protein
LLCKEGFKWTAEAEGAFRVLQLTLTRAPMLQLLAFDRAFIVECDASGVGFGAVLHQGNGLVAFFSHKITPRQAGGVRVQALRHW